MFSLFYLSVFQLVASELFPAAFDGEPLADPNFGAFFYNPTNFALHYALEAKNEAVNAVQAATSTSRGLQDSAAAAMEMCSSWESLGNIVGRPEISHGVFCQVGPKAAEGNEWKKCVDGTTKPASTAITYTGLCPGSWSAPAKDRSLKGSPADVINQCSSWKSLGNIVGRPDLPHGVFCQVGAKADEGNEWKQCVDGTSEPEDGAIQVTGLCPGSWSARSLGDSPADKCSSWKSLGHHLGPIPFSKGVFCQVGVPAAEGRELKQCVDGTTEPAFGIMYTGVCPGSITDDDIAAFLAAKNRSLQDTPDAEVEDIHI
jgi:hypothetical protein